MSDLSLPANSPLAPLIERQPTLVVFLRHFNCTFCREAIADVAAQRQALEQAGAAIVFVHPSPPDDADPWFARAGLEDVTRISDPKLALYTAFGLRRFSLAGLLSPSVWARGARCALSHGFGPQPLHLLQQLAGVFVAYQGQVLASYRHRSAADRPNYLALVVESRKPGVTMR
jgi:hypothetical protein